MRTPEYLAGYEAALEDIATRANNLLELDRDVVVRLLMHTETMNQDAKATGFGVAEGSDQLSASGLFLDGRGNSPNPYGIVFVAESGAGSSREDWIPKILSLQVTKLPYPEESA